MYMADEVEIPTPSGGTMRHLPHVAALVAALSAGAPAASPAQAPARRA
jgi:hypothetical protein